MLYMYGSYLKKKKKSISLKAPKHDYITVSIFTIEEMLKWYKSKEVENSDVYILAYTTSNLLKSIGATGMSSAEMNRSVIMLITNESHTIIKYAGIVTYTELEKDIVDMFGDKKLIILE